MSFTPLKKKLQNKKWRMNNLYHIIDKQGKLIRFRLNKHQQKFMDERHGFDIILKSRRLGFSTFKAIDQLDECLFHNNFSAGIIDLTEDDAKKKLDKMKLAYKNLPEEIIEFIKITANNKTSIEFFNGSQAEVGTSHRGSTLQDLHVSEYGPICRHSPLKAEEVKTGAFEAVAMGQSITVESTGRGSEGDFYEMVKKSQKIKDEDLGPLDFKLHFFPWFNDDVCQIEPPDDFRISIKFANYFNGLKAAGIELNDAQKHWYIKKYESLGDKIKEEYPSTIDEPFQATDDDKYYGEQMAKCRTDGRITAVPYEEGFPVITYWDLGVSDYTAIWFFQMINRELRLIDYYQSSGEGLGHYADIVDSKPYRYGTYWAPHDIKVRNLGVEAETRLDIARKLGINFKIVPNISLEDGIEATRKILSRCYFDAVNCKEGIEALEKYAKQWNEARGMYVGERKTKYNHGADSFRYLAVTLKDEVLPQNSYQAAHNRRVNNPLNDSNSGW